MKEKDNFIDYSDLIDEAMHFVVRKVLRNTSQKGLPGEHHFFITFDTNAKGVMISDILKEKYPKEMTIVIQYQFYDLEVDEDKFSITLSFDKVKHNLTVPFSSLISFVDPSVKFGLQFNSKPVDEKEKKEYSGKMGEDKTSDKPSGSNVVTLDSFRKK
jgi:hypothetical protein